jgi:hypothetical protein
MRLAHWMRVLMTPAIPMSIDFVNPRPPWAPMLLQLQDFGTSVWQL